MAKTHVVNETLLLETAPLVGAATDEGAAGKPNEDAYGYFKLGGDRWEENPATSVYAAVVADGVTSKPGGAQASKVAVDAITRHLQARAQALAGANAGELRRAVDEAVHQANEEIRRLGRQNPDLSNMSTTLVVAVIAHGELSVTHLGDSRAYLVRGNGIHRLTVDHTWIQQALDNGQISAADAKTHPNRNVIQRYLGIREQPEIDHRSVAPGTYDLGLQRTYVDTVPLQPGDIVLLCSDGQVEKVSDEAIRSTVAAYGGQPQKAAERLIRLALAQEEQDNITALLLTMPGGKRKAGAAWRTALLWGGVAAALLLLALTVTALAQMREREVDTPAGASVALATAVATLPAAVAAPSEQDAAGIPFPPGTQPPEGTGATTPAPSTVEAAADSSPTPSTTPDTGPMGAATEILAGVGAGAEPHATPPAGGIEAETTGATATATSAATAVPATATPAATATLVPTQSPPTATPRPTNTPTPRPPTATPTAMPTAMPTATGDSAVPKAEAVTETLTETVTESSAAGATEVAVPKVSNLETIDEGNGRRQFRWEAEGLLPPGATYEVAVWKKEGAVRGIVNIRETYVSVSLDNLYTSGQIETGLLHWGVRLVDTASGSEAQLLAQGDDFEYQPQSKSDNDGTKGDSTRG